MAEGRELIWVDSKLAAEYAKLDSVVGQEKLVRELIARKKLNLQSENESLQENLLVFKGVCLAHRKALEAAYEEENDKLIHLWESVGDIGSKVNKHAAVIAAEIKPISEEVRSLHRNIQSLKGELEGLNVYVAERLVRLAETVGKMDAGTKSLLRDLLNMKEGKQ